MPSDPIMIPGTTNDQPHSESAKIPGIIEPKMFPTEVWEFHSPIIKPRLQSKNAQ